MIDWISDIAFEKSFELWHLAVFLGLWFLSVYWEFQKNKPRKWLRIIALSWVLISLYIIYLSPYVLTEKPRKSVVIVSQQISKSSIDSLDKQYDLSILIQNQNGSFMTVENEKETSLNELDFLIDTAFVYGYLPHLNPVDYQFRKDIDIQKGIQLHYPKFIALGDSLSIKIKNLENKKIKIKALMGQDTVSKNLSKNGNCNISVLPKMTGYVLADISTDDAQYHLAVTVEKPENYVMQILSAVPDFEWKFLADYLKSKEHSVYQRTQISKDKFKSSFFNWHDSLTINRGVAQDLKVLFIDAKAWDDLSRNAQNLYLNKLKENKGSLIFRSNPNSQIQLDLDKSNLTNIFSTSDNLLESDNYKYLQFSNLYNLDEVAQNAIFRKVFPEMILGVINFQNSFQLKLSGKEEEYSQLWSPIFNDLIQKSEGLFYDKTEWSIQYQPFFFRAWTAEKIEEISIITPQSDRLKLTSKRDFLFPERHHFMFYPQAEGWHFIQLENQTESIPFYVHSETQASQSEFLSNYNYDYLNYLNFEDSVTQQKALNYNRESITMWFFVLFLMSITYLWIEDKIT
ncbi:hypothetical protein [Marivirga sp.]|uniref:hypothetical protein n=1 Tax=Marivirga sp. TaxID=2018662 RepID=UPI003DA7317A